jgi:hypothetical protein
MSAHLSILNPLDVPEWDDWLRDQPGATIFHSSHWARVLSETYGYKPVYFASPPGSRELLLVPLMEVPSRLTGRRGVSLPFTDLCPIFLPLDVAPRDVLNEILAYGRKKHWRFVEFRDHPLFGESDVSAGSFYHHFLKLSSYDSAEEYLRSLRHATRSSLKKAERAAVTVTFTQSEEALESYYRLNCLTRRRHGLPPQPMHFFRRLHEMLVKPGLGSVAQACHNGNAIAGAICLHFGKWAIVKYAAYDYSQQSLRPNNLLIWEIVRHYHEQGYHTLSFGRSDVKNEGLRRFKRGWKLAELPLRYYKYDFQQGMPVPVGDRFVEWSTGIMKHMPTPLLKLIGSVMYKHMG